MELRPYMIDDTLYRGHATPVSKCLALFVVDAAARDLLRLAGSIGLR